MLANLTETISGWASRRRKRSPNPIESTTESESTPVSESMPDSESMPGKPIVQVSSTPTDEDPERKDDPSDDVGGELRRRLECGIEELIPGTGQNSDARELLNSVWSSASSNVRQPPAAAQAVLSLCQRREYRLLDLIELIERDPSLSGALLRHANSAWYGTPRTERVAGVRAAVDRVGTQGVHAAVMSRIIEGALSRPGPGFEKTAGMVWDHMVRVAPIAYQLATPFGVDNQTAFTLGLLHDVGKLVLFHHISDLRRARRRDISISEESLCLALASLHEPLGGLVVLEWGLDDNAACVVANHHRCLNLERKDPLTEVVFLAERIDIAEQRGETLDVESVWDAAALTGPRTRIQELVHERVEREV